MTYSPPRCKTSGGLLVSGMPPLASRCAFEGHFGRRMASANVRFARSRHAVQGRATSIDHRSSARASFGQRCGSMPCCSGSPGARSTDRRACFAALEFHRQALGAYRCARARTQDVEPKSRKYLDAATEAKAHGPPERLSRSEHTAAHGTTCRSVDRKCNAAAKSLPADAPGAA